ncbi:MAG: 50S ribosomal protein L15 [Proteobacteria bacterium]|nr:50S ribosomal protein L15 [Pseudomonadota bacterium]
MLHDLKPSKGSTTRRKRVGRGPGSTLGKTCGHGTKGQKSRSGGKVRQGFEGGQMPLQRRLPKRGFTNFARTEYSIVNLRDLARFPDVETLDPELMAELRLVRKGMPVKVLGDGEIERAVTVKAHKISFAAAAKIEKAGGKVEII